MRADRLLSIMLLLRAQGRVTAGELASRLEVSERTVLRDIEALSTAGVPVYAERGRHGGFSLLEGFRADVSALDDTEAQVLFAYLGLDIYSELGLSREIGSTLDKLAASAPGRIQQGRLREVVHVDRRTWFASRDDPAERPGMVFLPALRRAASSGRRVRIGYRSPRRDGVQQRTVDPLGLVDTSGRWYLVAYHRGEPRTYRVSRITTAAVLDTPSHLPDGAVLQEVWTTARRRFEAAKPPDVTVRIRVDSDAETDLRTALQVTLADGGGLVVVGQDLHSPRPSVDLEGSFRVAGTVVGICLAFGDRVEILAPSQLRERSIEAATAALARLTGPHAPPRR